jgi:hypothetical protein
MIKEINGRWTCTDCGYEWSAMTSDDDVPEVCECQMEQRRRDEKNGLYPDKWDDAN